VGFPGAIFLRFLKCLVIPMIFCNMTMGIAEIAQVPCTRAFAHTRVRDYAVSGRLHKV
jgi:Na+/H+-dicarboxylate symporter